MRVFLLCLLLSLSLMATAQTPFRGTMAFEGRGANDEGTFSGRWSCDGKAHRLETEVVINSYPVKLVILAPADRSETFLLNVAAKEALVMKEADAPNPPKKPVAEWTDDYQEVLGYKCRKLILTTEKAKKLCWVNTEYTMDASRLLISGGERSEIARAGINGLLMLEQTLSDGGNYVTTFRVTLLQEGRVGSELNYPTDYTLTTLQPR